MNPRRVLVILTAHLVPVAFALAALASWATLGDAPTATVVSLTVAALMMWATAPWRHGDVVARRAGAR